MVTLGEGCYASHQPSDASTPHFISGYCMIQLSQVLVSMFLVYVYNKVCVASYEGSDVTVHVLNGIFWCPGAMTSLMPPVIHVVASESRTRVSWLQVQCFLYVMQ